jgi:hypothetical protein
MKSHTLERANAAAAAAVRNLRDAHGLDYSYAVSDTCVYLAGKLPEIDWLPPTLITVLQKWNDAAIAGGHPGLLGVTAPLDTNADRLIGLAMAERIRYLLVCQDLNAFNSALEAAGLQWLSLRVDVRDNGRMLLAPTLTADDRNGHLGWCWDVAIVSTECPGVWKHGRLVEQLVEQIAEQRRKAEAGGSGEL